MEFFPRNWASNLTWSKPPQQTISGYASAKGLLTRAGMSDHSGSDEAEWRSVEAVVQP
jgi:hypothetical protein